MEDAMTLESFAGHRGSTFSVDLGEGESLELELADVSPLGGDSDHRDPFSLLFTAPSDPVLNQQVIPLRHAQLGDLEIFLVPLGPNQEGRMQYEAVFS